MWSSPSVEQQRFGCHKNLSKTKSQANSPSNLANWNPNSNWEQELEERYVSTKPIRDLSEWFILWKIFSRGCQTLSTRWKTLVTWWLKSSRPKVSAQPTLEEKVILLQCWRWEAFCGLNFLGNIPIVQIVQGGEQESHHSHRVQDSGTCLAESVHFVSRQRQKMNNEHIYRLILFSCSDVQDIHDVLEVTVYDEDKDHKYEFLGKVISNPLQWSQ